MTGHQAPGIAVRHKRSRSNPMEDVANDGIRDFPLESQGPQDRISTLGQPVKLQAERLRGSLQAHLRSTQRGTINLRSINLK